MIYFVKTPMVQEIEILAQGNFKPEDILVSVSESNRKIDPFVESKLEEVWQNRLSKANLEGKKIYNGTAYRLNSFDKDGHKLNIDFAEIDYKTYSCLRLIPEYLTLKRDFHALGCYNCATIKTSDDKYILAELSGKSMNANVIEFIGGIMETKIEITNGENVFDHILDEMNEEANIQISDIIHITLKAIFIPETPYCCFYFEVELNTSSNVIEERFRLNSDPDIKKLLFLDRDEYLDILQKHDGKNKNFIATIVEI